MRITDELPDPARTDAGMALVVERAAGGAARLVSTADAVIAAWQSDPWPDGLLSYSLFLDTDGDLLMHYAQWTSEDRLPPLAHLSEHTRYRLYRGGRSSGGAVPGAIVAVRVDTDDDALAHTWVDAVFEALDQDGDLPTGGLGAFFHISTGGRRVLNYAEWVSADAHKNALAATGRGISQGPLWDKVQNMPGVRPQSVTRYRLYKTLLP